ncbi:MAG: UDP-N-acetylglucosamine--N-acetylmuramyl-(pentapeptide) pyrophosphoryl-undecaprenol [Thermosediminibacterales bacterium]|nr:UDP-N-acetylglucosamine--N-acetylmuramyl-(pentapeptide) pyrophosphoryl-undecaprenol [Thermosediminibacterales bacterium]
MKVMFAGGGTGGHIYPATAIANFLKDKLNDVEILFVGTEKGLESHLVPKEGFKLKTITVRGFKRNISLDLFISVKEMFQGTWQARNILRDFKPDIVIGTGGYVCGPVVFSAAVMGIPTLIHEQNVVPGITNRILSRFVDGIAVSFEESVKYFPQNKNIKVTGNPIRHLILKSDKYKALSNFRLSPTKKTVLVFGGSRGARVINNAMVGFIIKNSEKTGLQIIHITGRDEYEHFMKQLAMSGIELKEYGNIIIKPYIYNMQDALAAADLVVSRAGAVTIAEITALGKPSILIPLRIAANNHQEYNARTLESSGASVIISEPQLSAESLHQTVWELLNKPSKLKMMGQKSKALGKPRAVEDVFEFILHVLNH